MAFLLLCACVSSGAQSAASGPGAATAPAASAAPGSSAVSSTSRVAKWRAQLFSAGVDGHAVGYGGEPGLFWLLLQNLKFEAEPHEVAALLRDLAPQVRAFGLAIVAGQEHPDARAIAKHLCDNGPISYAPVGCIRSTSTVGRFARELLTNRGVLDSCIMCAPLLEPGELWRMDWELQARDDCQGTLIATKHNLSVPNARPGATLWAEMQRALPNLTGWRLARAIGRYGLRKHDEAQRARELLEGIVQDASQEPAVRLAAASALTRLGTAATVSILSAQAAALDALADGGHGTRMATTLKKRLDFESRMQPYQATRVWLENDPLRSEVIATLRMFDGEPFVFDTLEHALSPMIANQAYPVLKDLEKRLAELERRVAFGFPEWSIESTLAARIEGLQARRYRWE